MIEYHLSNSNTERALITISKRSFAIIIVLLIMNLRPVIIGQLFGLKFYIVILALTILYFLSFNEIKINKDKYTYISISSIIIVYIILQRIFVSHGSIVSTLGSISYIFLGILSIILMDKKVVKKFSHILIWVCAIFGISYIITYSIYLIFGMQVTTFQFSISTHTEYVYELEALFPFSPIYNGFAKISSIEMPRAIGFMREPGLYQMILIVSYWLQDLYGFKHGFFIKFVILLSLLFTFSSAGYLIMITTFTFKLLSDHKNKILTKLFFIIPGLLVFIYFVIYSDSQFGILGKLNSQSGLSRLQATLTSVDLIKESPLFGIGFHVEPKDVEIGINYLGTIAQLGIVGSIIFLLPFIYTYTKIKDKNIQNSNIFIAIVTTMLFAQPIYDKPIVFLLLALLIVHSTVSINTQKLVIKIAKTKCNQKYQL